jgi:2-polyprenyl-3-methyl-5-hydroxy-6-metoxy-1,4-benzoquinol methylase/uncharacterized protein YbaR (Trm112 family)
MISEHSVAARNNGLSASLRQRLVCPRDQRPLTTEREHLTCERGHRYPIVQDVPVMLLDDVRQTLHVGDDSLRAVGEHSEDPWFVDTLGCSPEQKRSIRKLIDESGSGAVDPIVQFVLAATNGSLYKQLLGTLNEYPIPHIRLGAGNGETLLDIGCNWGRWSIAAARKGYNVVGIDPSLGSVLAAKRVARSLGVDASFVVGDARHLPFRPASFKRVFSYSVLQHFSKDDVETALTQVARVLEPEGESLIQMANAFGFRSLQHQIRRRFRNAEAFEVRFWTPEELRTTFRRHVGESRLSVDGFFGLGIQAADLQLMPIKYRAVIAASEFLRRISKSMPITWAADSLYVHSVRSTVEENRKTKERSTS